MKITFARPLPPLCLVCMPYVPHLLLTTRSQFPAAWATRALIMRKLKGLEDFIDVTVVSPHMAEHGWPFANVDAFPGAEVDPLHGAKHIKDLYLRAAPNYEGRFSVPVLWDKKTHTVVNNESSEIIRIFNSAFNHLLPADKAKLDYYPEHLRKEIDEVNEWVYDTVNSAYFPPDASLA